MTIKTRAYRSAFSVPLLAFHLEYIGTLISCFGVIILFFRDAFHLISLGMIWTALIETSRPDHPERMLSRPLWLSSRDAGDRLTMTLGISGIDGSPGRFQTRFGVLIPSPENPDAV